MFLVFGHISYPSLDLGAYGNIILGVFVAFIMRYLNFAYCIFVG